LVLLFWYYYSTAYRDAVDFENLGADVAYVGNKECAYCHREIYQSSCEPARAGLFTNPVHSRTLKITRIITMSMIGRITCTMK